MRAMLGRRNKISFTGSVAVADIYTTTAHTRQAIGRVSNIQKFPKPVKKVLCANRGEIAVRIFRASHELGLASVGVYSHEDRLDMHRYISDESFVVGKGKSPVGAYLDMDDIIRIAKENRVDAIHPGYGFLSENSEFARRVQSAGLVWVGPPPEVIDTLGDKVAARSAAIACGVPVIPGTDGEVSSVEDLTAFGIVHGFPIIVKALFGGGGRGMRVITCKEDVADAYERATSEALSAFGNGSIFAEKYLDKPQHIEVQIIGDSYGNLVHLFERDCSVQRRFQKVVEITPACNLNEEIREKILIDAIKIGKHVKYCNAGTVEFLVADGKHYFIEVNPRVQVEHTVSEEVTGVDIVQSQLSIAAGASLSDLGLSQDTIKVNGVAMQVRVTTEDPSKAFQPDTGKLQVFRMPSGNGIRLDGASAVGRVISPHYDSLLVKLTARGTDFDSTVNKMLRACSEFRVRGVKTNIPFLTSMLTHETFMQNRGTHTKFIDETPELFHFHSESNESSRVADYLGNLAVNGFDLPNSVYIPDINTLAPTAEDMCKLLGKGPELSGFRDVFLKSGPKAFAKAVRQHKGLLVTDTTWRDAHQSLLATRMRTHDILKVAPASAVAMSNAFSMEMWGGATFDVCLRFLYECPWDRLRALRELVPNIPFQMLLRGANAVGYTSYPDNVVYEFCKQAKDAGIDVFRVFDSLNYMENLELGIDAVRQAGGIVEGTICYTGDIHTSSKYDFEYYMRLVDRMVKSDIDVLGIKDMAGLLKPEAASFLVGGIRAAYPDLPIHLHSHDTSGLAVASLLAAAKAGADAVDVACDSMSGTTSQGSMGALVAAVSGTKLDTGLDPRALGLINDYWEGTRALYAPFESPSLKSGNADVFTHEMPGGQYTNLQYQAFKLGLGSQWPAIKKAYAQANRVLGDIVKVTPSSKVVGDLAQFMVQNELDETTVVEQAEQLSFPVSVVDFLRGDLGVPTGGFPEPFRSRVIKNATRIEGRPGSCQAPLDLTKLKQELTATYGKNISDVDVMSAALYPEVFKQFAEHREAYGNVSVISTREFFQAPQIGKEFAVQFDVGRIVYYKLLAIGDVTNQGTREVFWEINGNARSSFVEDKSAGIDKVVRAKAIKNDMGSIGAPMSGAVVGIQVKEGDVVDIGDSLVIISAMKMETVVSSPIRGIVGPVGIITGDTVAAQDLMITITPQ